MKSFKELCKNLQVDLTKKSDADLNKLIAWCQQNISTDIFFTGLTTKKWADYTELASNFISIVLTNEKPDNLTESIKNFNNMSTLQLAVKAGFDIYLQKLKPSPEQITQIKKPMPLLHLAATQGYPNTTKVLLDLGADPTIENINQEVVLFAALRLPIMYSETLFNNKQQIFLIFMKNYSNLVKSINNSGDTIVQQMAIHGFNQSLKEVLKKHPNLSKVSNKASHYPIHTAILNAQLDAAKILLKIPGNKSLVDSKQQNFLHYAARYGNDDMVKLCCETTKDIDANDFIKQTALILAVIANNVQAINQLLKAHANPSHTDKNQRTALHYAVEKNSLELVQELLKSPKTDVNAIDLDNHSPLDLIVADSNLAKKIEIILVEKGATHNNINNNNNFL